MINKLTTKPIGKLIFEAGWNGGLFKVQEIVLTKNNLPSEVILEINKKNIKAKPVYISGQDYDSGHTYDWKALDFEMYLNTEIGQLKTSLRYIIESTKLKSFKISIES